MRACPYGECARGNESYAAIPIFVSFFARASCRSCPLRLRCCWGPRSGEACRGGAVDTRDSGTPNGGDADGEGDDARGECALDGGLAER